MDSLQFELFGELESTRGRLDTTLDVERRDGERGLHLDKG